jgi:2-polyprenyl-6-methoxyphenol hydroxylase-like FAD-dependent oxidoreductase
LVALRQRIAGTSIAAFSPGGALGALRWMGRGARARRPTGEEGSVQRRQNPEVLVVGAGPIGSATALHLSAHGVEVAIVDPRFEADDAPSSVLVYPDTLRRLEAMGFDEDRLGPSLRLAKVALYEGGERRGVVHFEEGRGPRVAGYDALEQLLWDGLEERKLVVSWQRCVSSLRPTHEGVALRVGELDRDASGYAVMHLEEVVTHVHDVRASWVIATDEQEFSISTELDVALEPTGEEAIYASFELRQPSEARDEMRIVLDGAATATSWPSPSGGQRMTWRLPDDGGYREVLRAVRPEPTVRHLVDLLRERHPWFTADADDLVWARVERFQPTLAKRVGEGRIFLIGEAAHRLEPLSSRELNEGLLEAERIAENVAGVIEGVLAPTDLGAYVRDVRSGLEAVSAPARRFEPDAHADPWLAERFERFVPYLPADGRDLDRLLADLGVPRRKAA